MKPSTCFFVALYYLGLVSAASIANPDDIVQNLETRYCFNIGTEYGNDKDEVLAAAWEACTSPLQGTYRRGDHRLRCYNIGRDKHVKFTLGHIDKSPNHTLPLSRDECYKLLAKKISNCEQGGDTIYGIWRCRQAIFLLRRVV